MGSCRFDAIGAILVRIGHGYGLCLGFRVTQLAVRVELGSSPGDDVRGEASVLDSGVRIKLVGFRYNYGLSFASRI